MVAKFLGDAARKVGIHPWLAQCRKRINYTRKARINGAVIRIPSICGLACNPSEPWMTGLLAELLPKRSGVFLDVGVNMGQTLVKLKALEPERQYVGFEPNPTCVFYVQDLIRANSFSHCRLLPVGLFARDCIMSLDLFSDNPADSSASLIENFRPTHRVHSRTFVPVFQFDGLGPVLGNQEIGIVKIDVEGAELEVVKCLVNLIRRDRPMFLIEVLPAYSDQNADRISRQKELEDIFNTADYELFRVEKTREDGFAGLRRLEEIGVHGDLNQCDYVMVPKR